MYTPFLSSSAKFFQRGMDSGDQRMSPPPRPPAQLHEDLVCGSILPRLPVRSLARFATVSKAWCDLILGNAAFAALQAQNPSVASAALARFHNGLFEVLAPGGSAASVAPPDPSLSFLTAGGAYQQLELCACTGGLLCLTAVHSESRRLVFFVCNPATRSFHLIRYGCPRGVAGLAYDPATAERGYDMILAATQGLQTCRFFWFSSRAAGSGWRARRGTVRLALFEALQPKPAYAGGRLHWLTNRGNIVWHDVARELCGTLPPPPCASGGGNMDLGAWSGRLRLACATNAGLGLWELASYGGAGAAARWDTVHWRSWRAISGVVAPERCFMWSVVPAGMEAGGEEAVSLALRHGYKATRLVDGVARKQDVVRRALVRYDRGTGATAAAVELTGREVHDGLGTVFGYHSSLAALPRLNMGDA
ncbi:hypothetical protein GQ55_9G445100 [Panicum hallii var. hallii]|uniref:F-box domain-containing protein n=1 Tax=Panicum hallii var. hallii TaxID=1504633 RepID=A0A2T7CBI3_9POAL|nr:hypothetical protein GQ55_9G445100 [Panicum hallii var. hallii]